MFLTLGLTHVVNGGCLVEPHELSIASEGILFAKDRLGSDSLSFKVLSQCHRLQSCTLTVH